VVRPSLQAAYSLVQYETDADVRSGVLSDVLEIIASAALLATLACGSARPEPLTRVVQSHAFATAAPTTQATPPRRDSLKNGAIIGAIAGGLSGIVLGTVGCATFSGLGDSNSSCTGGVLLVGAIGSGLGVVMGLGIDAMFEQAPYPGLGRTGKRTGLRMRIRF
jgi:hypothetical protein